MHALKKESLICKLFQARHYMYDGKYGEQHCGLTWNMSTHLKRGTTFQITVKSDSGEIAVLLPCHNATRIFRNSSTTSLLQIKKKPDWFNNFAISLVAISPVS